MKSKLFNITIILLLLVNTVAVAFILLKKDKHRKPPPPQEQRGSAFDFLVKELKLDSNQISQYSELRGIHKNSADSILTIKRETKDSLFSLLKTNSAADANVQQQLNIIAQLERNLDELTFNHFKKVRALCTAQQQVTFDEVIAKALRMQAQQKHRKPPPPREGEENGRPEDEHRPPPPPER